LKLEQVVMTHHIASATEATREEMALLAVRNLVNGLLGSDDIHIVPELRQ